MVDEVVEPDVGPGRVGPDGKRRPPKNKPGSFYQDYADADLPAGYARGPDGRVRWMRAEEGKVKKKALKEWRENHRKELAKQGQTQADRVVLGARAIDPLSKGGQTMLRKQVRARRIIQLLQWSVEGQRPDEEGNLSKFELSAVQVRAALGLLGKVLPDLQSMALAVEADVTKLSDAQLKGLMTKYMDTLEVVNGDPLSPPPITTADFRKSDDDQPQVDDVYTDDEPADPPEPD